ncbi:uncharacterized protein LOC118420485 [Branchiostoma floridae]|uniref:Uncharacterized protein LOC118420485 n=1 Tax=Branchiostoma floridae TaxID=7739 RepID=A0A9J7MVR8_BRAFL|nr:uncharacterized protein LOC118420485 [Branchiostoma floridae]
MSASNITAVPGSVDDITKPWVLQMFNNIDPDVTITQVDITGPIGEGLGVMSDLVALVTTGTKNGKEERYSLVVKLTSFGWMKNVKHMSVEDYLMFDTAEVKFYAVAVPDFLSLLSVKNPESEVKPKTEGLDKSCSDALPVPKCYFTASDQTSNMSVRVLENLATRGFSIKPYPQTLDVTEMKLTVGALARIHGLSHRLELQSGTPLPDMYDWMVETYTTKKQQWYSKYYKEGLETFAAAFPGKEGLMECLRKLDGVAIVREAVENPARLKVLCHADCWNNNIMFKYEDGKAVDVKLVDWQMVSYRPPTFDLVLLFMYQTWDIFHNHRGAILEYYYQELQRTLGENEATGLQFYTLDQLEADFRADMRFAVYERLVYGKALLPSQLTHLLRIVLQLEKWGVI